MNYVRTCNGISNHYYQVTRKVSSRTPNYFLAHEWNNTRNCYRKSGNKANNDKLYCLPKLLIDDDDDTLLIRSWPNPSVLSTLYVLFGESIFNLSLELMRLIPLNGDNVSTTRSFRLFSSANANVTKEFSKCNTIHWSATTNSCKIINMFIFILRTLNL